MRIESVAGTDLRQNGKMFRGCSIDDVLGGSSKKKIQGDPGGQDQGMSQGNPWSEELNSRSYKEHKENTG